LGIHELGRAILFFKDDDITFFSVQSLLFLGHFASALSKFINLFLFVDNLINCLAMASEVNDIGATLLKYFHKSVLLAKLLLHGDIEVAF
jgi:hypothetical protein